MDQQIDEGEFVRRANLSVGFVSHAIEAGMITPAGIERLRQAL